MAVELVKRPDCWTGTTEIAYPRFEAWQSNDDIDNCWCLNIRRSAGQEPITVRKLQSLGAAVEFIKGFLCAPN